MKAIVKTNSNYKNANGIELDVVECLGTIICCLVPDGGFDINIKNEIKPCGKMIIADFNIKEIVSLKS